MAPKFAPAAEWEYRYFSYSLQKVDTAWSTLADFGTNPEPFARDYLWQVCEAEILAELRSWQDDGWEAATEPASPKGLYLNCFEHVEQGIDLVEVMMWIATFGVALLFSLLFGRQPRRYLVYKPSEFTLLMRRAVTSGPYIAAHRSSNCLPLLP